MGSRSRRKKAPTEGFASTERLADIELEPPLAERVQRVASTLCSERIPACAGSLIAGKYRLDAALACGAMGAIWRARHLLLDCDVALKLMHERFAASGDARERFLREARTAARLRGPHVVQLLDYGIDGDTPYLVMELLEGESLRARLLRAGKLSKRETSRIIRQLAQALERARKLAIVHRDLSPSNVFLVDEDGVTRVKLLDFGIAKWQGGEHDKATALTVHGAILGTPSYMSPEQLESCSNIDHRSDIWALGAIAFECLVGRLPFRSDTFPGLVLAICSRALPVPSALAPLPASFDAWFFRACARSRNERFGSAREAAAELRRALKL